MTTEDNEDNLSLTRFHPGVSGGTMPPTTDSLRVGNPAPRDSRTRPKELQNRNLSGVTPTTWVYLRISNRHGGWGWGSFFVDLRPTAD